MAVCCQIFTNAPFIKMEVIKPPMGERMLSAHLVPLATSLEVTLRVTQGEKFKRWFLES